MSDQNTDPQSGQGDNLADLRAAADEGRKLKRENVMLKAGVDTTSPLGQMFATSGYTGELDVDKVKEAWSAIAPQVPAETPPVPPTITDDQAREDAVRRGIATGTQEPPPPPEVDRLAAGKKQYEENLSKGMSQAAAGKPVIDAIIMGAIEGDDRFVFNGWTAEEMAEGRTSRA